MKRATVDASLVGAAFFREPQALDARTILRSGAKLHAPDLIHAELGNVIWKRFARGEIVAGEARELVGDVLRLPLRISAAVGLLPDALELAMLTKCTVYDCLYVALAIRTDSVLLTCDRRLVNTLSRSPFARHVQALGRRV